MRNRVAPLDRLCAGTTLRSISVVTYSIGELVHLHPLRRARCAIPARGDDVRAERCIRVGRDQAALGGVLSVHVVDFTWFLPNRETGRPRLESVVWGRTRQNAASLRDPRCLRHCYSPVASPLTPRRAPRCAPHSPSSRLAHGSATFAFRTYTKHTNTTRPAGVGLCT